MQSAPERNLHQDTLAPAGGRADPRIFRETSGSAGTHVVRWWASHVDVRTGLAWGLSYTAEVSYETLPSTLDDHRAVDVAVLNHLKEAANKELDCHVCYNIMLDPVTTPCGHTFCRICLTRVLDHTSHCPVCRRSLQISPTLTGYPSNKTISALLSGLCPELIASRAETVACEEGVGEAGMNVPIFVCTLAFPGMPTFLHIFEPRYRLMLRRVLQGNGQFGMVMYNYLDREQGALGRTDFMHYGTLVQVLNHQYLEDGRIIVESRGISRFKIMEHSILDGYVISRVERHDDIPLVEEERIEAEETSGPEAAENDLVGQLNHTLTRDLLMIGVQFVMTAQARSARWMQQQVLDAYGGPPDDPAIFPYWLASVLPISEEHKYELLRTTSVRERLKITVRWIRRIEASRW